MKSADFQVKFDSGAARDLRKLRQKVTVIIPSIIKTMGRSMVMGLVISVVIGILSSF